MPFPIFKVERWSTIRIAADESLIKNYELQGIQSCEGTLKVWKQICMALRLPKGVRSFRVLILGASSLPSVVPR